MAAQPLVRRSYADPVETYSTNVMGLVNLLETVRVSQSVKAVVNVTSDKCYENREWIWAYRENDPMGGFDPYSSSKGCAEIVTAAYRRSFLEKQGIGLASARAGNVIGGGDWATDRLVPDILRALSVGKCAEIRNPSAIRPWQHVLEPLSGYLRLAECLYEDRNSYSEGWNFGPSAEQNCSVGQLASQLVAIWGNRASWSASEQIGPHEANLLSLDCTKARQKLMWRPRWEIGETLDKIVQWQSAYLRGADMHDFTLSQIGEYQARKEKHE
jgi:CDP-glucose 4,6-dehydratase